MHLTLKALLVLPTTRTRTCVLSLDGIWSKIQAVQKPLEVLLHIISQPEDTEILGLCHFTEKHIKVF